MSLNNTHNLKTTFKILTILVLSLFLIFNTNIIPIENSHSSTNDNIIVTSTDDKIISTRGARASYIYHNYSSLVTDLEHLNSTYPELIELTNAQTAFGLPDCQDGYKIWMVRITNESRGTNKPEVFFVGGHHGNEPISIEVPYYLIEFLVQNYASNNLIRYLLDHREIYVMPVVNPWGWENNKREDQNLEDMNRDYPYGNIVDSQPLSTLGARAVVEFMNRHQFGLSLSWHSGEQLIYYAWGTPVHDTPSDESPDNIAFFEVAKLMSNYAGGSTKYSYGPANQMFLYGGVFGAWSDYAYAAAWDTDQLSTGYDGKGARSLAFGIEISKVKKPDISTLGNPQEVLKTEGVINGFIPQNIRMALVLIDLAEPYLSWRTGENYSIPTELMSGSKLNLSWYVNGSFVVSKTRILYGTNPDPVNNYSYSTKPRTGNSHWSGEVFTEELQLPEVPGDYYFIVHAQVDQNALIQNFPEPKISPQSQFVLQRTNDTWKAEINENTIEGKKDWYSPIIHIKLKSNLTNQIWITDHDNKIYCNEDFNISLSIETNGILNYTGIYWGMDHEPKNQSEHFTQLESGHIGTFSTVLKIPNKPGFYYFIAVMGVFFDSNNTEIRSWSQMINIEAVPRNPFILNVSLPKITYVNDRTQSLSISNIICTNPILGNGSLDNSSMVDHRVIILRFDPVNKIYLTGYLCDRLEYDLVWSQENNYWYLHTQNVSNMASGWFQVFGSFKHIYGEGKGIDKIDLELDNWFRVEHLITVETPNLNLKSNQSKIEYIDILNVTGWCSKDPIYEIEPGEVNSSKFFIKDSINNNIILTGNLTWSSATSTWQSLRINISVLQPGKYYVICRFSLTDLGSADSKYSNMAEFIVPKINEGNNQNDNSNASAAQEIYIIVVIIVVLTLIMLLIISVLIIKLKLKTNRRNKIKK